jgi:hypothetical protein
MTDAPQQYHLFSGLVVLSALLGNRVSIPFGPQALMPNLYVVLIGRSTFSRKTTSIAIAQRILRHFEGTQVLPSEFSPEAFLDKLGRAPAGLLIYPEFSRALAAFRRDYMAGMVERLTELYDSPPHYSRELRGGNRIEIERPVVSILAGSTLEWLQRQMGEDDVRGGFFPRFLFVSEGPKNRSLPIPPPPDLAAENRIVQGLAAVQRLDGLASLASVQDDYEGWYRRIELATYAQDEGEATGAFVGRLTVTALKLALLYHVAEYPSSLAIGRDALARALALVGWLQQQVEWLLRDGLAFTRAEKQRQRVLAIIRRRRGVPHSALLKASHLSARELREALETLGQDGSVEVMEHEGVKHYYAPA